MRPLALLACALALAPSGAEAMNRLSREKSPYLLQHADNPVDWHPWGEEAFAKARRENKPIFLSVGYATCHWCHVMERESFEDARTAAVLNALFVNVKVDREERPDVDKVYMDAALAAGWGGGWPLSLWLTPELKPFFGGTYFPPDSRFGRPGFAELCERIGSLWTKRRADLAQDAERLTGAVREAHAGAPKPRKADARAAREAFKTLLSRFDERHGGFGDAPKFPMPANQAFLLRYGVSAGEPRALELARKTLAAMARGGIYDQLGGGFHRYSTDEAWRVPHFEKMLYDNAQLAVNLLEAYQAGKDKELARAARGTLDYVLGALRHPEGGFYSAEDADSFPAGRSASSGKEEGAFYLWTQAELLAAAGPDGELAAFRYGTRPEGNALHDPSGELRGKNVLYAARGLAECSERFKLAEAECGRRLDRAAVALRAARAKRPRPAVDDKILASWNGLMLSALAKGAQVLEEPAYREAAEKAARFLRRTLYDPASRRLYHRWRDGERAVAGFSDDYAYLAQGLVDLYEASQDPDWLDWALELAQAALDHFEDPGSGGFYMTEKGGSPELLARVMDDSDGVEPSANSVLALTLLRLAQYTDEERWRRSAERVLERFGAALSSHPLALPQMLAALDFQSSKPKQVVIAGEPEDPGTRELLRLVHDRFLPNKILIVIPPSGGARERMGKRLPFLRGALPLGGKPTAYICAEYACRMPTSDLRQAAEILDEK